VPASGERNFASPKTTSPAARVAASTRRTWPPVARPQATTAAPLSPAATAGPETTPPADSVVGSVQSPPAGRKRAWIVKSGPCSQATVALPWRSTETAGLNASLPAGERSRGAPKPPPATRIATDTRRFVPS
jgi:hypothetical protein